MHNKILQALIVIVVFLNSTLAGKSFAQDSNPINPKLALPTTDEGLAGSGPIRRYEWFQKVWLERRSKWERETSTKQGALVFLGDSITQGWGDEFRGVFGKSIVANRGISGDTTRGMLLRLKDDVLKLNPSGIVLLMGTNDLEEKAEPTTVANNLELILGQIKAHNPKLPVALCLVFPSSETKSRPSDKIKEINNLFQAKVKGDPQVTVLDTWTLFADEKGNAKIDEFPDLLHPNEAGYYKWEVSLRPLLEVLGLVQPPAESISTEPGFEPLFNGKDLTGWCFHPTTEEEKRSIEKRLKADPKAIVSPIIEATKEFSQKKTSDDGRYAAIHGRLVVTTPAEGRRIQQLWTTREFKNDFVLKLEFRATPNADSGVFVRGKQLQCRDYLLAGPYKQLKSYKPQQWNALEITVTGNTARCLCNGETLEESFAIPASGPIGLEGDRGQMEYRNIRIKVMP
ncbi:MAG: GDSL-type esterase/lipase family protein [Pirellula sp.]